MRISDWSSDVCSSDLFLQHLGVDIAALGFEDDAQILGAFVADILEDRELLVGDQLRDLLDQLALGDPIGDFADDELPGAARQFLDSIRFPASVAQLAGDRKSTRLTSSH